MSLILWMKLQFVLNRIAIDKFIWNKPIRDVKIPQGPMLDVLTLDY